MDLVVYFRISMVAMIKEAVGFIIEARVRIIDSNSDKSSLLFVAINFTISIVKVEDFKVAKIRVVKELIKHDLVENFNHINFRKVAIVQAHIIVKLELKLEGLSFVVVFKVWIVSMLDFTMGY